MGKLKKAKKGDKDNKAALKAQKKAKGEKKQAAKETKSAKKQKKGKDTDEITEDDLIATLAEFRERWAAEHKVSGELQRVA